MSPPQEPSVLVRSNQVLLPSTSDSMAYELVPAELVLRGSRIDTISRLPKLTPPEERTPRLAQPGAASVAVPSAHSTSASTSISAEPTARFDFGDRPITPAFVNAHTHLALGFLRGHPTGPAGAGDMVRELFFEQERKLTPQQVRAFVRMGAYESLLSGVGLAYDHYYFGDAVAQAFLDTGLSGVIAPTLQDLDGPGMHSWEDQLEATGRIAEDPSLESAGIYSALGPHATDTVSEDLWRKAQELAVKLELPIHAHCSQSLQEVQLCQKRHGTNPIDWLLRTELLNLAPLTLLTHCLFASAEQLNQLKQEQVALNFCPSAQKVFGFPADPTRFAEAKLEFAVATDTSAGNDSMNLQKELRAIAEARTVGMHQTTAFDNHFADPSPENAEALWKIRQERFATAAPLADPTSLLSKVWDVPGRFHPAFKAGTLQPGALANLVVWDQDHPAFWPSSSTDSFLQLLAMGDTTQAIYGLFVSGRCIGQPGDFHRSLRGSDAYREALDEANARLKELSSG